MLTCKKYFFFVVMVIFISGCTWKPQENNAFITSEMKVFHVLYFDPGNYESLLGKGILISFDNSIIHKSIQPWKGYGLYSFVDE
jgi:hypothetical protein